MTGIRRARGVVYASGTWHTLLSYIGRGALRGIRLENMANSGPRTSGTDRLRITVDQRFVSVTAGHAGGYVMGSGMIRVPYLGENVGQFVDLAQFVMNADYHERGILVSGIETDPLNNMRIPFDNNVLVEYYLYSSGVRASGIDYTVLFEGKGEAGHN